MKATSAAPEVYNGAPVRLDSVDSFIFQGLQDRFLSVFNTPTVWSTSTAKVKALDKLFKDKGKPVSYPYAFLSLNTWQRAEDRASIRASTLRGTRVSVSTDSVSTYSVRFLPVDFTIGVEWYFNNYGDLLDASRRWMFIQQRGSLNFQVGYGQTSFDIKTVPEPSVTFPKREADPDNVQEYMLETSLNLLGYISETEVIQQGVVNTVEITASLTDPPTPESVAWTFKSKPVTN